MPQALQVVNFYSQGIGGGSFEDLTAGSGDSATFQNVPQGSLAYLADVSGVDDASPAEFSLTASRFHDQVLGIVGWVPDGSTLAPVNRPTSITPPGFDQPIYPSDIMAVRVLGTAGDNVNLTLSLYYSDLPGISAKLANADAVKAATVNLLGVDVTVDPSAGTQGDWSPSVALSAASRRLDADRHYAILGFTSATPLAAVGVSAFETGNLKVGGPVLADGAHDANQIADMAEQYNAALIPIINGSNQDNVLVWAADPAAGSTDITVQLAELSRAV